MRKQARIVVAGLIIAVAGLITWQVLHDREPVYEGKRLSKWLAKDDGSPGAEENARRAVLHAGTNGIPTLLSMLCQTDSPLKCKLMDLAQKQRFIRIDCTPAERLNAGAWVGFEVLGARAESAVPTLMEVFNRRITWWSQLYAVKSLGCMGPAAKTATPVLLAATTNSHFIVRAESLAALVHIHADPELATTALVKGLSDPTSTVRHVACVFLAQVGEDARQAVPALVNSLKDPDSDVRYFAARALKAVDVEAAARAGVE